MNWSASTRSHACGFTRGLRCFCDSLFFLFFFAMFLLCKHERELWEFGAGVSTGAPRCDRRQGAKSVRLWNFGTVEPRLYLDCFQNRREVATLW